MVQSQVSIFFPHSHRFRSIYEAVQRNAPDNFAITLCFCDDRTQHEPLHLPATMGEMRQWRKQSKYLKLTAF